MGHHFFVSPGDVHGDVVELSGAEAHHAARALRIRTGEAISVADGTGRVLDAVVVDIGDVVRAEVRNVREPALVKPRLALYQAVPKGDRMENLIEKAVEIGVDRLVPFLAERTIVRWDERKQAKATERWSAIAKSAAKQCRSPNLMAVERVRYGVTELSADGPVFVLHERTPDRLRDRLPAEPPDELVLIVGPEGGLAEAELESLQERGAKLAGLGERILRTDTAGLVGAAIVRYAYGSLG